MEIDPNCDKYIKKLGLKLREIRLSRGWTLEQTEEHGWTSWRHLQKIEAGKNITVATLWKLAKVYKVKPADLLKDL
jgi:transcriptional regulator with XRE-family HTH domain